MRIAVFVVSICKDFESKVFDVGRADGFNVDGIIRADTELHLFKNTEKGNKEIARGSTTSLEADTDLRCIVCACRKVISRNW